jgi:hypothetical protein
MHRKTSPDDLAILPFPTAPISNGEYAPRPPAPIQTTAARIIAEETAARARRHGMTRGEFLRSAAATATAFWVLNKIHGLDAWGDNAVLPVRKTHCDDLDAGRELLDNPVFVMDVQMHHVDTTTFSESVFCFLRFRNRVSCPSSLEDLTQANFIKEVFVDSQTSIGVISGLPSGVPLGPETMAETRDLVNDFAGSQRCLAQAMIDPAIPLGRATSIDSMEHQVRNLRGAAVKCYTYNGVTDPPDGPARAGWRIDDERVAYPMLAEAQRLGLRLINIHKGLPAIFAPNSPETVRVTDFTKAVRDWPKLRFCAYHSAYFGSGDHPEGLDAGMVPAGESGPIPGRYGIEEFIRILEGMPRKHRKRVYAEIGSTFAITLLSSEGPLQCAHLIGRLLKTLGPKNILWGTDSIWWGSPQFLIDAFKTLQIPAELQERYGYPPLTEKAKTQILGTNAAQLYGIKKKVRKTLCTVPVDSLEQLKVAQGGFRANRSLRTYGPRTRREFLALRLREGWADFMRDKGRA